MTASTVQRTPAPSLRTHTARTPSNGRRWLLASVRLGLLLAAAWALHRELASVSRGQLSEQFAAIGWPHIALAVVLTIASFALLGVIEVLGLRFGARDARRSAPVRVAFGTSFVANAFSQSVGLAVLTGTAVRLRSYARFGLSGASVGQVSAFVTITSTLGLLAVGAWGLATEPATALGRIVSAARPLAVVFALVIVGYVAWSAFGRRAAVGRGNWIVMRPTTRLAVGQIALSAIDWLVTGAVLFAVLPDMPGVGFAALLRAYVVAQVAGVSSHVPAGAGVFEVVMMLLLVASAATGDTRAAVAASLVMFRVIYYLVPLCAAVAFAGLAELTTREVVRVG